MLSERIPAIQSALAEAGLDGWLFACFQRNDPIGLELLGLGSESKLITRRCYYLIPKAGEPRKLVHDLEAETNTLPLVGRFDAASRAHAGQDIEVVVDTRSVHCFDLETGRACADEISAECARQNVSRERWFTERVFDWHLWRSGW